MPTKGSQSRQCFRWGRPYVSSHWSVGLGLGVTSRKSPTSLECHFPSPQCIATFCLPQHGLAVPVNVAVTAKSLPTILTVVASEMAQSVDPIVVDPSGDLILDIRQDGGATQYQYRVNSRTIRQNSKYFDNLFSDRFNEGQKLSAGLESLKSRGYTTPADAPTNELPHISIENIGRIYTQSTIQNLAADFLIILHGQSLSANPPVANLANIAVVADRFDALAHFTKYMLRKKYLQAVDAKSKGKPSTTLLEEKVRQKLLIGLLFDHPPWVTQYSKHLIMRDSVQWIPGKEVDDTAALWWDLPHQVEGAVYGRMPHHPRLLTSSRGADATARVHPRNHQFASVTFFKVVRFEGKTVQIGL